MPLSLIEGRDDRRAAKVAPTGERTDYGLAQRGRVPAGPGKGGLYVADRKGSVGGTGRDPR